MLKIWGIKMNEVIILVDRSAGNDSVGDMWTETHIFDKTDTLETVINKVYQSYEKPFKYGSKRNIRITVPIPQEEEA